MPDSISYVARIRLEAPNRGMISIFQNVHQEPENVPIKDPLEDCSKCNQPTNHWLTPHIPLCPICAEKQSFNFPVVFGHTILDVALAEIGIGFLVVGRVHLATLILQHVPAHLAPLIQEGVNYMASKCNLPHSVKVVCLGKIPVMESQNFIDEPSVPTLRKFADGAKGNLLLSGGGLDSSTTALVLAVAGIPYETLFFSFGQAARNYEWESINLIDSYNVENIPTWQPKSTRLEVNLSILRRGLAAFEDISNEGTFPCRNWFLYFTSLASIEYTPRNVFINIFKGEFDDNHADHSPRTFDIFQRILMAYSGNDCHLLTPFKYLDKSDLAYILRQKFPAVPVAKIRSCYCFFRNTCGGCTGCVNKFVSIIHAGFTFEDFGPSRIDPRKATKLWIKYWDSIFSDKYPDSRRAEIAYVCNQFLSFKPTPMTDTEKPIFEKYLALDLENRSSRSALDIERSINLAIQER